MCKEENLQITRFLTVGDREGLRVFVSPKDRLPPVYRKKGELIISVDDFIELSLKLGPISPEGFDALAAAADRYGACALPCTCCPWGHAVKKNLPKSSGQRVFRLRRRIWPYRLRPRAVISTSAPKSKAICGCISKTGITVRAKFCQRCFHAGMRSRIFPTPACIY